MFRPVMSIYNFDAILRVWHRYESRWPQALDAFAAGTILPTYLGQEFARIFALTRREESNRFQTEVSNRDYEWYLRAV